MPLAAAAHLQFLSRLPPLPCREDLAALAQNYFFKTGKAAEIGVYQGGFSSHNLLTWQGEYYAIDTWQWRPERGDRDKNFKSAAENDFNFQRTLNNTARWRNRTHLVRSRSLEAATRFDNNTFDWIFIDALHTREALHMDLMAWWPKLRVGGLMTGDDFGDGEDQELLPTSKFKRHTPLRQGGVPEKYRWGVISALREFAAKVGAIIQISYLQGDGLIERPTDCYVFHAWYLVKPPAIWREP